jgi:uncharacterized membrane protein YhaH (DUF805 family)
MVLRRYADFDGRSQRAEYWMFALLNIVVMCALFVVGLLITNGGSAFTMLFGLYCLAVFIPSIAVGVRRLHDTGRSGWWLLLSVVPLVSLILLVFFVEDGTPGGNEYGPNPKTAIA